ncbi:hypothetical protein GCM10010399_78270 [Dactylosporangium fulvum]|uniref:Lipoprotein n=1 Tax=Dactylosporangium fulvum TaxID=53359 RepID=A0ABY5VZT1_9ACTN|nr:hypothetical protein [Dactylosporangium fulvum]UWP82626.1 hypothetical protein Dfulv_47655 [Dactylosporangium fulvum]
MRTPATALAIVALGCLLTGCTSHDDDPGPLLPSGADAGQRPSTSTSPTPVSTPIVPPTRAPSASSSASPSPSAFSEAYVVQCNGRPSGDQVIAAVRKFRANLPAGSGVTVKSQPLCAGIWQYTILNVANSEPMQVMTKGSPQTLTVVTAGTDPCTVEVKATAPAALLNAAAC